MSKKPATAKNTPPPSKTDSLRLNPQNRLCPLFDSSCIAMFPVGKRDKMGFRVVDNCCEDHIM